MDERKCDVCGRTEDETHKIKFSNKAGCYLCQKHKSQLNRYGKFLDNEPRTTNDKNDYIIDSGCAKMIIRNSKQEIVAISIIDIEDVDKCKKYKWNIDTTGYITCKYKKLRLHRFVMDYNGELQVDHINRNKLDNRKINLRVVSIFVNNQNNGAIGVSFDKHAKKWKAEFLRYGSYFNVGIYDSKEDAIKAREKAIKEADKDKESLLEKYYQIDSAHVTGIRPSPHGKWLAKFCANRKVHHVGTYLTKEEAIEARLNAIKDYKNNLPNKDEHGKISHRLDCSM